MRGRPAGWTDRASILVPFVSLLFDFTARPRRRMALRLRAPLNGEPLGLSGVSKGQSLMTPTRMRITTTMTITPTIPMPPPLFISTSR